MKPPVFGILLGSFISLIWVSPTSFSANEAGIIRFSGEASQGTSFKRKLWNDLVFVLTATDGGWDISVTDGKDADTDFVWVATPPYRFDNPRYLGAVYGRSAKEAVAWTPRPFSFVINRTDYSTAEDAVRKLLWPSGISDAELRVAELNLMKLPKAHGLLKINQTKLSEVGGAPGRIESLAFEVEIRQPIDLHAALRRQFLAKNLEYERLEEACPGPEAPITIGKALYHDFDGDGFDEAAVLGYSCLAGTGGADLHGVFTRLASGETVELAVSAAGYKKTDAHLRGHFDINIVDGSYAEEFWIYRDKDSNCCPTGGTRRFVYRWNGKVFLPAKIEDVPDVEKTFQQF
jgi:hypothetical protein